MTHNFLQLTEDEFDQQFPLLLNHLNPQASWGFGESGGCLFETYGDEFEFVRRQAPDTIWTIIDGDDGDLYVINGLHFVNRVGYLISQRPVLPNTDYEVHVPFICADTRESS